MSTGDDKELESVAPAAPRFSRVRKGYDPAAVDRHIRDLETIVDSLRERSEAEPTDSSDVVVRATKRSIERTLQEARDRADAIVAGAERRAEKIDAAAQVQASAALRVAGLRQVEIDALEDSLRLRRETLSHTTSELRDLAERLAGEEPAHPPATEPARVAALSDRAIEIDLRVDTTAEDGEK